MTKGDIICWFLVVVCLGFIGYRMIDMPIDDIIFLSLGMIWATHTAHLMIENDYLKIHAISYKRRIKKLEKDSQNK